jgi:hypothetical protein
MGSEEIEPLKQRREFVEEEQNARCRELHGDLYQEKRRK